MMTLSEKKDELMSVAAGIWGVTTDEDRAKFERIVVRLPELPMAVEAIGSTFLGLMLGMALRGMSACTEAELLESLVA